MKIFFENKKPGIIESEIVPIEIEIESTPSTVKDLIISIVERTVSDFSYKQENDVEEDYKNVRSETPGNNELQELSIAGKIAFGLLYNGKKPNISQAIETALQGYDDGLYKIFVNGKKAGELNSGITVEEGDVISVIRLAFLSGRLW